MASMAARKVFGDDVDGDIASVKGDDVTDDGAVDGDTTAISIAAVSVDIFCTRVAIMAFFLVNFFSMRSSSPSMRRRVAEPSSRIIFIIASIIMVRSALGADMSAVSLGGSRSEGVECGLDMQRV